jgi:hypothetical protein
MHTHRSRHVVGLLAGALLVCSCGVDMRRAEPQLFNAENEAACFSEGGRAVRYSFITFVCMWKARDAGKSCTDNRDCQGVCEVPESAYIRFDPPPAKVPESSADAPDEENLDDIVVHSDRRMVPAAGTPMTGVCSALRARGKATNCITYVADGVVAPHICWD